MSPLMDGITFGGNSRLADGAVWSIVVVGILSAVSLGTIAIFCICCQREKKKRPTDAPTHKVDNLTKPGTATKSSSKQSLSVGQSMNEQLTVSGSGSESSFPTVVSIQIEKIQGEKTITKTPSSISVAVTAKEPSVVEPTPKPASYPKPLLVVRAPQKTKGYRKLPIQFSKTIRESSSRDSNGQLHSSSVSVEGSAPRSVSVICESLGSQGVDSAGSASGKAN